MVSIATQPGDSVDVASLKSRCRGRWPEVLAAVCGIDSQILDGRHHPCPRCGGHDRFSLIDADAGALLCRKCFSQNNGDGIAAVAWLLNVDFRTACERLSDYLHLPATNGHSPRVNRVRPPNRLAFRKFATWQEAVADAEQRLGKAAAVWPYHDHGGRDIGIVCRWDTATGKEIRPFAEGADGGWTCGAMPTPRPIFRLPEILRSAGRVWITEGEKAADALRQLGLVATTSAGGAQSAKKTDWSPLAGREVIVWPDHDLPGTKYKDDVLELWSKLSPNPTVRVVDPTKLGLGAAGDAADWIETRDAQLPEDLTDALNAIADAAEVVLQQPPKLRIEFIDSAGFARSDFRAEYLVKRVLVRGQPCIMGGAQKTLKTSVAVDLAISLGTGTKFLGEFEVPHAVPVGVLSGESGAFTLQETARRIAQTRNLQLSDAEVYWGFKLPQLGLSEHLAALADAVKELGLKCLIVDPAYLCLLRRDDGSSITFSNLFEMGDVLSRLNEAFAGLDCTLVILHHESKSASRSRSACEPPELSDLSMSGFAEWARQWILIGRREKYEHGSGVHRLWLNVGGSMGHGGLWAVDVNEGQLRDDFSGRKWEVSVSTSSEVRKSRKEATESRKTDRDDSDREKLLKAYRTFPEGETAKQLAKTAKLNNDRFKKANQLLLDEGLVKTRRITKGNKQFDGFTLVPQDVDPDRINELFN